MKTIAERLQSARKAKDLTQAQLAVLAGLSQGTVGNIESGGRAGIGSLAYMSEPLGVSFRWLAEGIEPRHIASIGLNLEEKELVSLFQAVDQRDKATLLNMAKLLFQQSDQTNAQISA